jgi:ABC-type dipeptide/oligopeptide/nickel transport system permease subunit
MDLANMYSKPSALHIMGTDGLGRDQFTRLLYGGRYSLGLGISASLFGALVGVILGSIAGYFGGRTETLMMRLMDIWSSLPGMLLCILISATLGKGFVNTVIALAIGGVPESARYIRAQILKERSKEYLEAAEAINCSKFSIMFRHLLPNVVQPVLVNVTMGIGMVITMAAALSYIGLGVQPPTPEWGALLSAGRSHILNYPYLIMFPGLVIAITVLAINLMGDGLRDALDPKLRS